MMFGLLNDKFKIYLKYPLVWVAILSRIFAAAYIYFNPLWGWILSMIFDCTDWWLLKRKPVNVNIEEYHELDKILDNFTYIVMLITGIKYGVFFILSLFFVYRLIGYYLYTKTKKVSYFVLFPNFFEMMFVWFVIFRIYGITNNMSEIQYWGWFIFMLILKEGHEIFLHLFWNQKVMPKWEKSGYPRFLRRLGYDRKR
jgi:hypothetical protein